MTVEEYAEIKRSIALLTELKVSLMRTAEQRAEGIDIAIKLLQKQLDER